MQYAGSGFCKKFPAIDVVNQLSAGTGLPFPEEIARYNIRTMDATN
jgi:hypothetical protein